jgi:hypothetical protein
MEADAFCQVPVPQGVKVATPKCREGPPDQVLIWMCHLDTPLYRWNRTIVLPPHQAVKAQPGPHQSASPRCSTLCATNLGAAAYADHQA